MWLVLQTRGFFKAEIYIPSLPLSGLVVTVVKVL